MSIFTNKSAVDKRTLGVPIEVYKIKERVVIDKIYLGTFPTIQQAGKATNMTGEAVHYILKHTRKGVAKTTRTGYTFNEVNNLIKSK